jgi:lipopolysaccharide/colanic/teichoic acid biosynthesis glycosyltransferase
MKNLQAQNEAEKYLKATPVASYHSEIAYDGASWGFRPVTAIKDFWYWSRREAKYLIGEYALSNAFVIAFLARAKRVSATQAYEHSSVVNKAQFAFNWICALIGLGLLLPLFALIGLAIKVDSPGPIFYKQERVGLNRRRRSRRQSADELLNSRRATRERRKENVFGKPFEVYKFRSMVTDAEKRCGPIWATANDPRITRVGRVLRKTRLDEFPQLINVLRGQMSIVGPRPERPFFIQKLSNEIETYTRRLDVLPGITGLAQVEGGYDSTIDDVRNKVNYDIKYIESASIKKDLTIMFKTVGVMLGGRGM